MCVPAGTNGECPVQSWAAGAGRAAAVSRHVGEPGSQSQAWEPPCPSHLLTPPASYRTVTSRLSQGEQTSLQEHEELK